VAENKIPDAFAVNAKKKRVRARAEKVWNRPRNVVRSTSGALFSTIEWLGAYDGNARIAQIIPGGAGNFEIVAGIAAGLATTAAIPEPSSGALLVLGGIGVMARRRART
jgi:hypothetical protein